LKCFGNGIFVTRPQFRKNFFQDLISACEDHGLNKSKVMGGDNTIRTSSDMAIYDLKDDKHDILSKAYIASMEKLVSFYGGIEFLPWHIHEGIGLLRYGPDEYYKKHVDSGPDLMRSVSMVLYLNDDYLGGEINFPNQGIKIKPNAGDLLIFPSSYTHPHESMQVKEGVKYVAVTWFS